MKDFQNQLIVILKWKLTGDVIRKSGSTLCKVELNSLLPTIVTISTFTRWITFDYKQKYMKNFITTTEGFSTRAFFKLMLI